jgi:hypothetical protein
MTVVFCRNEKFMHRWKLTLYWRPRGGVLNAPAYHRATKKRKSEKELRLLIPLRSFFPSRFRGPLPFSIIELQDECAILR